MGFLERPTPPGSPDVGRPSLGQGPELARHCRGCHARDHHPKSLPPAGGTCRGSKCMGRHRVLKRLKLSRVVSLRRKAGQIHPLRRPFHHHQTPSHWHKDKIPWATRNSAWYTRSFHSIFRLSMLTTGSAPVQDPHHHAKAPIHHRFRRRLAISHHDFRRRPVPSRHLSRVRGDGAHRPVPLLRGQRRREPTNSRGAEEEGRGQSDSITRNTFCQVQLEAGGG